MTQYFFRHHVFFQDPFLAPPKLLRQACLPFNSFIILTQSVDMTRWVFMYESNIPNLQTIIENTKLCTKTTSAVHLVWLVLCHSRASSQNRLSNNERVQEPVHLILNPMASRGQLNVNGVSWCWYKVAARIQFGIR